MESYQKSSYPKKNSNYRGGYKKHYRGNNQQYRNASSMPQVLQFYWIITPFILKSENV